MLGACHLVAVHRGGQRLELALQLSCAGAKHLQLGLPRGTRTLGLVAFLRSDDQRDLQTCQRRLGTDGDRRRDRTCPSPCLTTFDGLDPRGALVGSCVLERLGAASQCPHPLLAGAHCEPGVDLGLAGRDRGQRESVSLAGRRVVVLRRLFGGLKAQCQLVQGGAIGVAGAGRRRQRRRHAICFTRR